MLRGQQNIKICIPLRNCPTEDAISTQFLMILEVTPYYKFQYLLAAVGRESAVDVATSYGLDGPGIESRGGEIFRTRPDRPWGLPSLLYNGYRVFLGCKTAGVWRWSPTHI